MDDNRILMKNNYLIKAKYDFSVIQSRIFILMLYKLQKAKNGDMVCTLTRKELKEIIPRKSSHSVKGMSEVLDKLMGQRIYFKEIKSDNKHSIWGKYSLINGFEYDDEYDSFKLSCSNRVYELLTNYLEIGYTPINLTIFLSLKSVYAQRMYDLLRLWSNTKIEIDYSVSELKELLMVENKYKNFADFKKNILVPAVKGLNDTGMFEITYTPKKTGRAVTNIIFKVKDLDKRKYFEKKEDMLINDLENKKNPIEELNEIKNDINKILNKFFTKGTRMLFDKDFKEYEINFNDDFFINALYDSVCSILDKDKIDVIEKRSYNYFKRTLENRIQHYIDLEVKELIHKDFM